MRTHRVRRAARLLPIALPLLWGCHELFLPEEPGNGALTNFEFVWEEVDRHYSFFELKGVDWEGTGDFYRRFLEPGASSATLFSLLSEMLARLQDGHVGLRSPFANYRYAGWYQGYPHNFHFDLVWGRLLEGRGVTPSGKIYFGWVTPEIGYIHIPTFTGSGWAGEVDDVLELFAEAEALVVDVRDNSGGNDRNAVKIAGRFTSERRLYRRIQYRNGPDHSDFTRLQDDHLEPAGRSRFSAPVALLTNRRTFSAGESLVLAMRTIPRVMVVGDTTGGGSGNPLHRELPNGWSLSISRWIEWAPDGTTHEGVGLAPDRHTIIPAHLVGLADPILMTAVQLLQEGTG